MSTFVYGLRRVTTGNKKPSGSENHIPPTPVHTSSGKPTPISTSATTSDRQGKDAKDFDLSPSPTATTDYWNGTGRRNCLTDDQRDSLFEFWRDLLVRLPKSLFPQLYLSIQDSHPDSFVLRFLRARKFNVGSAVDALINTLEWRDDPARGNVESIIHEGESRIDASFFNGRAAFVGYDYSDRIISLHMSHKHEKGSLKEDEMHRLTVYMLETGRLFLKRGKREEVTLLFDMTQFGLGNADQNMMRYLVRCMTDYYPESLGLCLVLEAPWVFSGVWKVIKGWLDPVVVRKIRFIRIHELESFVPKRCWPAHFFDLLKPITQQALSHTQSATEIATSSSSDPFPADDRDTNPMREVGQGQEGADMHGSGDCGIGREAPKSHSKGAPVSEKEKESFNAKSGLKALRHSFKARSPRDKLRERSGTNSSGVSASPSTESMLDHPDRFEFHYVAPTASEVTDFFTPERSEQIKSLRQRHVENGDELVQLTSKWAGSNGEQCGDERDKFVAETLYASWWEYDGARRFPTCFHRLGVLKGDRAGFPRVA